MSKMTISLSAPAFPDELPLKKQLSVAKSSLLDLFKGIGGRTTGSGHSVQTFTGPQKGNVMMGARKILEPLITSGEMVVKKVDVDQIMPKLILNQSQGAEVAPLVTASAYVVTRGSYIAVAIQSYTFGTSKPVVIASVNAEAFKDEEK